MIGVGPFLQVTMTDEDNSDTMTIQRTSTGGLLIRVRNDDDGLESGARTTEFNLTKVERDSLVRGMAAL